MDRARCIRWLLAAALANCALSGSALAQPVPIEVASDAQKQVARKQLQLGIDLFKAQKYDEALEMLRMSHEKVASPNTRLMIANTLVKLDQLVEAYRELQQVLEEAEPLALGESKYERTVEAARAVLKSLDSKLGFVQLRPGATISMDGDVLSGHPWSEPLPVLPGRRTFQLALDNGQQREVRVDVMAGQTVEVDLSLEPPTVEQVPPPEPAPPLPPVERAAVSYEALAWSGVAVAAVGAASFAVFGALSSSRHQQLLDECAGTQCPASLREVAEEGRTYQTLANVGLGVGVVGLIGATTFFVLDSQDSEGERGIVASTRVGVSHRGVLLQGSF